MWFEGLPTMSGINHHELSRLPIFHIAVEEFGRYEVQGDQLFQFRKYIQFLKTNTPKEARQIGSSGIILKID